MAVVACGLFGGLLHCAENLPGRGGARCAGRGVSLHGRGFSGLGRGMRRGGVDRLRDFLRDFLGSGRSGILRGNGLNRFGRAGGVLRRGPADRR